MMIDYLFLKKFRAENKEKEFPYEETNRIQKKYPQKDLEDLNGDLNTYYMAILGAVSRMLNGTIEVLEVDEVEWFKYSFFEHFPMYQFIEKELVNYPKLHKELEQYEKARKQILLLNKE